MKVENFAKSPETIKKITFKKIAGKTITVRDLDREEQIAYYEQKIKNLKRRLKALETMGDNLWEKMTQNEREEYNETLGKGADYDSPSHRLRRWFFEEQGIKNKIWDIEQKIKKLEIEEDV